MTATALAVRPTAGRPAELTTAARPFVFRLGRHDIQAALPAALRSTIAKGFLEGMFKQALRPEFLYPAQADVEPFPGRVGDKKTFTRSGLMTPTTSPVTPGSDASVGSYSIEQWSVTLDRYGKSLDTDMLADTVQMASQYVQDVKTLGIHAGQSLNQIARNKLVGTYAGGRTYATSGTSSSTTLPVADTTGFGVNTVNGVLTAVSGANPLTVTVNGVANTVVAVSTSSGAGNLTLGSAVTASAGWIVTAANAPVSYRAGTAGSLYQLTSSDIATLAMFRNAATRMRKMSVPMIGGAYTALVSHDTVNELYSDSAFTALLQGRIDSPVYGDLAIGRIAGIDFVPTAEAPTVLGGSSGTLSITRDVVFGAGALVATPLPGIDKLLSGTGVEGVPGISMVNVATGVDVALITRPPQDRFQSQIATTWQWVGDYGVPTDLLAASGDPALYKRAVVLEHA